MCHEQYFSIVPAESAAPSMMKLASVSFEEETTSTVVGASHGCARNNGGCEHLCIPIGNSEKVSHNSKIFYSIEIKHFQLFAHLHMVYFRTVSYLLSMNQDIFHCCNITGIQFSKLDLDL